MDKIKLGDENGVYKKYNAIDLTKFIMAIFVVALHVEPLKGMQGTFFYQIYNTIARMAVPFFFITSGYLLFYKMTEDYNTKDNMEIIKRYIFKMIKLYIIWSIIYLPLAVYKYIQNGNGAVKSSISYIRNFFFVGEHYFSWQLWYLLSTVYGAVFISFLLKRRWKEWKILILSLIVYAIAFRMDIVLKSQENFTGILHIISFVFPTTRVFYGFCYLSIGMCIAKYKFKVNFKLLLLIDAICFIITVYFNNFISTLLLYIFFFMTIVSINLKDREIYYYFREASTIIYFSHMLFLFIWTLKFSNMAFLEFLLTLICSFILSILLIIFQKKKNYKFYKLLFH